MFRQIAAMFAALTMMFALTACRKDDGMGRVFKYDISANPETLDPQQANDSNSNTIIGNMFVGLFSIAQDGSVQNGAAEDYSVSDDGLTYRFKLKENIFWVDVTGFEKLCTAKDFVFGFQRLFMPQTEAPRAHDYYCIKNSRDINKGHLLDYDLLGVKATGDFELEIVLEYPNPRFLSMLAEPPSMPCNEEYFKETQGKYGLSAECTPSNGSFYLKSWTYNQYNNPEVNNLILGKNYKNAETQTICPSGLNFFIEDESEFISDFKNGDVSCLAVSNDDKHQIKGSFDVYEFNNITAGIVFNTKNGLFSDENFRRALCMLIDRNALSEALPDYEIAAGIVPKQVTMNGSDYRKIAGDIVIPDYNAAAAKNMYEVISNRLDKTLLTGSRIIVPDSAARTAVSYIMQAWQRELGFYCNVEILSENEYAKALKSGEFDIAVLELSGKYNSPAAYLEKFSKSNSDNYTGFYSAELENFLDKALEAADYEKSASLFLKAEQTLIDRCAFFPLYCKNEYFFTAKGSEDIIYNPFSKTVNFTLAKLSK